MCASSSTISIAWNRTWTRPNGSCTIGDPWPLRFIRTSCRRRSPCTCPSGNGRGPSTHRTWKPSSGVSRPWRRRRVIIYVGEEAAFCPNIEQLSTELSELLHAPTIWSINGANAVSPKNPYSYGYVLFGGNDKAMQLWRSMTPEDIVITLGFWPGEHSINLESFPAKCTWHFGAYMYGYGQVNGDFRHRCKGDYRQVRGDIGLALEAILPRLKAMGIEKDRPKVERPENLNSRTVWRAGS